MLCCGCSPLREAGLKEYKETRPYLGAYVTIQCFYETGKDIAAAINQCWKRMDEIQHHMNAYAPTGDLAEINRSGFYGVRVGPQVYQLLKDSVNLSRVTEGAFDVTVFPLVEFWRNAAQQGRIPSKAAVAAAKSKVGYQGLRFEEPDRIMLATEEMKVDLGGIVSGYACDEMCAILEAEGIRNFLIDTGGEILCRGQNKGRSPWLIGIQDPQNKARLLKTVELKDSCVSTSGNYEKFYTIEGVRFSHIIDPLSGYPQKEVISATVIAKTATQADALSTALCVVGSKKAVALLRRLDSVEAMIIERKNGRLSTSQTRGFP